MRVPKLSGGWSLPEDIQFLFFFHRFFSSVSAYFCFFLLSDLMHFALIFLLFRFVIFENKKKLRPDVKAFCQTFNAKVFLVETPNCLDIN